MKSERKPNPKCPHCGTNENTMEILYGFYTEPVSALDERKFKYGGCGIDDDSPRWECEKCGRKWGKVTL